MTTYCKECDIDLTNICDFCKHFYSESLRNKGCYSSDGKCTFHSDKPVEPEDSCSKFYCYRIAKVGEYEPQKEKS